MTGDGLICKMLACNKKRCSGLLYRKEQSVFAVLYGLYNHCWRGCCAPGQPADAAAGRFREQTRVPAHR